MGDYPYPDIADTRPEVPVSPEQQLALQVVRLALSDARGFGPYVSDEERVDAREFLHSEDLDAWLAVAGFPPRDRTGIRERIARVLAEGNGNGQRPKKSEIP